MPQEVNTLVHDFFEHKYPLGYILSGADHYKDIMFFGKPPFALQFPKEGHRSPDQEIISAYFGTMKHVMDKLGFHGFKPGQNIVISVNNTWILKSAGFANRLQNITAELGLPYGSVLSKENVEEFISRYQGKTYQTITRMACWLRAKEAIEKLNLDRIRLPNHYLVHIPGRPTDMCDANYVIVEEQIPDLKSMSQTDLLGDAEVVRQLTQLIGYSSLWDVNEGNLLAHGDQAVIVDFESPNVHKPSNFYMKDKNVFRSNCGGGWLGLRNRMEDYARRTGKDLSDILEEKDAIEMSIQQAWK